MLGVSWSSSSLGWSSLDHFVKEPVQIIGHWSLRFLPLLVYSLPAPLGQGTVHHPMIAGLYLSSGSPLLLITLHHPLRVLLGWPLLG